MSNSEEELTQMFRYAFLNYGFKKVHDLFNKVLDEYRQDITSIMPEKPKAKVAFEPELIRIQPVKVEPENVMLPTEEKSMKDLAKEKKDKHLDLVKQKRMEMMAQGIDPENLCTEPFMKECIEKGFTYWKIAELTGASDSYVSTRAKSLGLQSNVRKAQLFGRSA